MSTSNRIGKVAPYLGRLLNDDHVQDQVRDLVTDLRQGATRAKRKGAKKAVSDKRVRRRLAGAAVAAGRAARTLREPEPPKRHPIRRALGVAAVAGAAAAIYRQRQSSMAATQPPDNPSSP
jgi:hypothetical protein